MFSLPALRGGKAPCGSSNIAKPFQKMFGVGAAETIAGSLVKRFGESRAIQLMQRLSQTAAGRIALSAIGEGGEEVVEAVLQPFLKRATYDPNARFNSAEAWNSALVGRILGGLGGNVDVADAFLEGFLDGDTEPVQAGRGTAAKGSYPGEALALPQGGVVTGLADSGGGRLALEGGGGLPGVVDFGELYAAALQNGFIQPGTMRDWRAEVEVPALYWEFLQNLHGVQGAQPAVPLLPEWSGGGWEGLAEIEGAALVPMFQDAVETGLEAENRREFAEFQAVLGDDAPKSLAEFLDLKYNQPDKWDYTKRFAGYMKKYPNSGKRYFDVQETLRIHGIDKGIALPPIQKKAFILPDGKYDPYHIMHRMMERQITDDQIRGYIKDAKIMFVQWNGQRQRFVGVNGTCVITKSKDGWIFKTAWKKSDNDEEADKIMEAIRNAGL